MSHKSDREKAYIEGLERFLDASDEDHVNVDALLAQLPRFAQTTFRGLKERGSGLVLDVGAGNGAKALHLARQLEDLGIRISVHSLEPKAEQRAHLERRYQGENRRFFGTVRGHSLEEMEHSERYDLVLLIHSLYEFPRANDGAIASLAALRRLVAESGVASIVIEHPDGDFQRMKHELYPSFGKKSPVSLATIERTLQGLDLSYTVGETIDFSFDLTDIIDRSHAEIGQALSFLFSDSLADEPLPQTDLERIGSWVQENIRRTQDGRSCLWTPDITVWVTTKA